MEPETKRQIIHILLGSAYAAALLFLPKEQSLLLLLAVFAFGSLVSYTHARITPLPFIKEILERVEREKETHIPGRGALSFTLGALLGAIVFYTQAPLIAVGAVLALTFGDGFSTILGRRFGKTRTSDAKTLEGTIGGIIAAAIALSFLFKPEIALASAIFGMIAEYIPINDNYAIPLVSGIVLAILL